LKILYLFPLLLIGVIPITFAENSLENEHLFVDSSAVSMDLQFGDDDVKYGLSRIIITPTIENMSLTFYDDEINMSDSRVKVYANGNAFSIVNFDKGIIIYGHYNKDLENYEVNIYFAGQDGLVKYSVSASSQHIQSKIIKPTNNVISKTNIDLNILTDQYERVYNKSDYKFFVKTFDDSIYSGSDFDVFQGKVSGAKVSAIIIDPDGEIKSDVNGYVENGIYEGSVYIPDNLWQRGWYTVDIVVEFEGKFYQEQLSFYVYGEPAPSDGKASP